MIDTQKLLSRIDLTELAERAGAEFRSNGRGSRSACPLHHGDNNTAFSVYKIGEISYWRCYTDCQTGGDAIDFYQKLHGVDFINAVRDLAEFARLSLDDLGMTPEAIEQARVERLRSDVLNEAAKFFSDQLWGPVWGPADQQAREWLAGRGFTKETVQAAGWGFSTSDQALVNHLSRNHFDLDLAKECGLIRADGCDFTANANGRSAAPYGYIIYPHRYGERVTYFSSRAVEAKTPRPDPKDKSRNLPGPRQCYWSHVPGSDSLVIVEGPADAESLRQLGISSLALCGLGEMPETDLVRVKHYETIYHSLDGDQAGQSKLYAADSSQVRFLNLLGPMTRIVHPYGCYKDFNDLLQHGVESDAVHEHLSKSTTWLDMRLHQMETSNPAEMDCRMIEIGGLLGQLPMASQLHYSRVAAKSLGISTSEIKRLIAQAQASNGNGNGNGSHLSEIKGGKICFLGETLMNCAPKITHELIMDDGENPPVCRYTITGKLDSGDGLESIEIPAEEFATMAWVPRHWGARAVLYVARGRYNILTRAIQEISMDELKRERVYQFTGWTNVNGVRSYLSASGALSANGLDSNIRVDLGGNNLRHYNLPQPPTGQSMYTAIQASIKFLSMASLGVTAPIWAAIYAGPLTSARSLNAVLWVYGPTQSGKSTISHLALSHYGAGFISGREYHSPMDWTSTATSLEGAMFKTKDSCIVIDDFAPQFTSRAESMAMHKKASLVARSVGNRSARGRAKADLSEQVTRMPRGLVIATAENPLMGQSVVGRMIYVCVEHGQVLGGGRAALDQAQQQAQQGVYAQAMSAYIQWLAANWERATEMYQNMVEAYSKAARLDGKLQNRLPDYFGVLNAAQELALTAFFELGAISALEKDLLAKDNENAILTVISGQAEKIALESPVRKFMEAIASMLSRGMVYLAPRRTKDIQFEPPQNADKIGWYDALDQTNANVYLDPDVSLSHAKKYWSQLDENLDILSDALCRQIDQAGMLSKKDPSRTKVNMYVEGRTTWVLAINATRVREMYGVELSNKCGGDKYEPHVDDIQL